MPTDSNTMDRDLPARLNATAERLRTTWPGGAMVWRAWGQGPPLVLMHGASGSWTHWIRNIEPLARHFRVFAPDLPGFGDSDEPPPPPTAETLAGLLADGLEALFPAPAAVDMAGFSFGGIIGGLAAARPASPIRTLVLLGTGGMALPRAPLPSLRRMEPGMNADGVADVHRENLGRLMFGDPARVDALAVQVHAENLRRSRFRSSGIPESDVLLRALPRISAQLAGIWGSRDPYALPYLEARRDLLLAYQPEARFRTIEGAGHWTIYEAASQVNATLLEWLLGEH